MQKILDAPAQEAQVRTKGIPLSYQFGFGNEFKCEAVPGALPEGQNSPRTPPMGLYSELITGTAFTAPRHLNRRSYVFRIHPSVFSGEFQSWEAPNFKTPPLEVEPTPHSYRWDALKPTGTSVDFLDSIFTICGNGSPKLQTGLSIHAYRATKSMARRAFCNADGEFLVIPQFGDIRIVTEFGMLDVAPGEFALLPKGVKFRVDLLGPSASGCIAENYGHPYVLPELGLLGSWGLANPIDFQVPIAAYEEVDGPVQLIHKFAGKLWAAELKRSPFDVVAWRGNLAPCKYDMTRFVPMGSGRVDWPDPSIMCALTSPSSPVNGASSDLMIVSPHWVVSEDSLPIAGFHRNVVAEFFGAISGAHHSKPGVDSSGMLLMHNNCVAHGPTAAAYEAARAQDPGPSKRGTLGFMIESRFPFELSTGAIEATERQREHARGWDGYRRRFTPHGDRSL